MAPRRSARLAAAAAAVTTTIAAAQPLVGSTVTVPSAPLAGRITKRKTTAKKRKTSKRQVRSLIVKLPVGVPAPAQPSLIVKLPVGLRAPTKPSRIVKISLPSWLGRRHRSTLLLDAAYSAAVCPKIRKLARRTGAEQSIYGEVTPAFVSAMLADFGVDQNSSFVDLGSGVGNVTVQAYLETGCAALGCEIDESRHDAAVSLLAGCAQQLASPPSGLRVDDLGTPQQVLAGVVLRCGDCFTDPATLAAVAQADVILSNNLKLGAALIDRQGNEVLRAMKAGAVFVSMEKLVRGTKGSCARKLVALGVSEEKRVSGKGGVSWREREIEFYVYRK